MDDRTGQTYETQEAARKAGVPERHIVPVRTLDNGGAIRVESGPFKGRIYELVDGKRGRRLKGLEKACRIGLALARKPAPASMLAYGSDREVAESFHRLYEELAPQFGYETRADTKAFDPESNNGRLMTAVCGQIAGQIRADLEAANDFVAELLSREECLRADLAVVMAERDHERHEKETVADASGSMVRYLKSQRDTLKADLAQCEDRWAAVEAEVERHLVRIKELEDQISDAYADCREILGVETTGHLSGMIRTIGDDVKAALRHRNRAIGELTDMQLQRDQAREDLKRKTGELSSLQSQSDAWRSLVAELRKGGRELTGVGSGESIAVRHIQELLAMEQRAIWIETQWSLMLDHVTNGLLSKPYEWNDIRSVVDDAITEQCREYANEETAELAEQLAKCRAHKELLRQRALDYQREIEAVRAELAKARDTIAVIPGRMDARIKVESLYPLVVHYEPTNQEGQMESNDPLYQELEAARRELQQIDNVLARRPALAELATRAEKIERAINVAKKADDRAATIDKLRKMLALSRHVCAVAASCLQKADEQRAANEFLEQVDRALVELQP